MNFQSSRSSSTTVVSNTHALDFVVAFVACRRDESLETVLAVELSLLLHEANVLKGTSALAVDADEMIGAPNLAQGGDERPPGVTTQLILQRSQK